MSMLSHSPAENDTSAVAGQAGDVSAAGRSLFPLPLVPFERYLLVDDRPDYPMTFFVRIAFSGQPDRAAMDAAFAEALGRHPLLTARVSRRWWRMNWEQVAGPAPQLIWHEEAREPAWPVSQTIDLRRGPGIHGYVHVWGGHGCIVLSFHHAACDGIGCLRFIGDMLAAYGRRTTDGPDRPKLLPLDPESLRVRGQFDLRFPTPISRWVALKGTMRETWKVLTRRPQVLKTVARSQLEPRSTPTLAVESLPADLYQSYSDRASESNVTINDLLMRDMFLTIQRWNEQHARRKQDGWLRITMPTSLRGKRDTRMPATNTLGYAFVTRHTSECGDPDQLLAAIAADTAAIRTWSLGAMFVDSLRRASRIPGLFWLGSRLGRRFSTIVLSNLGDPSRRFRARLPFIDGELVAGNLHVKSMFGGPPIRPGTRAAVALFHYPQQLVMAMNSDSHWFSEQDSHDFLGAYRRQLIETATSSGA